MMTGNSSLTVFVCCLLLVGVNGNNIFAKCRHGFDCPQEPDEDFFGTNAFRAFQQSLNTNVPSISPAPTADVPGGPSTTAPTLAAGTPAPTDSEDGTTTAPTSAGESPAVTPAPGGNATTAAPTSSGEGPAATAAPSAAGGSSSIAPSLTDSPATSQVPTVGGGNLTTSSAPTEEIAVSPPTAANTTDGNSTIGRGPASTDRPSLAPGTTQSPSADQSQSDSFLGPTTSPVQSRPALTLSPSVATNVTPSPSQSPVGPSTSPTPVQTNSPLNQTLDDSVNCTVDGSGRFGSTAVSDRVVVDFAYQLETTSGTNLTAVLVPLERSFNDELLPSLFEGQCGTDESKRKLQRRRRLSLLGISPLPRDVPLADVNCTDPSGRASDCTVVNGELTIFHDGTTTSEAIVGRTRLALRLAMTSGAFDSVDGAIQRVTYLNLNNTVTSSSDPEGGDGTSGGRGNYAVLWGVVSSVLSFIITWA